jgi:hypothetical protein
MLVRDSCAVDVDGELGRTTQINNFQVGGDADVWALFKLRAKISSDAEPRM